MCVCVKMCVNNTYAYPHSTHFEVSQVWVCVCVCVCVVCVCVIKHAMNGTSILSVKRMLRVCVCSVCVRLVCVCVCEVQKICVRTLLLSHRSFVCVCVCDNLCVCVCVWNFRVHGVQNMCVITCEEKTHSVCVCVCPPPRVCVCGVCVISSCLTPCHEVIETQTVCVCVCVCVCVRCACVWCVLWSGKCIV